MVKRTGKEFLSKCEIVKRTRKEFLNKCEKDMDRVPKPKCEVVKRTGKEYMSCFHPSTGPVQTTLPRPYLANSKRWGGGGGGANRT